MQLSEVAQAPRWFDFGMRRACHKQREEFVKCVLESECVMEAGATDDSFVACRDTPECMRVQGAYILCRSVSMNQNTRMTGNRYQDRSESEERHSEYQRQAEYEASLSGTRPA